MTMPACTISKVLPPSISVAFFSPDQSNGADGDLEMDEEHAVEHSGHLMCGPEGLLQHMSS